MAEPNAFTVHLTLLSDIAHQEPPLPPPPPDAQQKSSNKVLVAVVVGVSVGVTSLGGAPQSLKLKHPSFPCLTVCSSCF